MLTEPALVVRPGRTLRPEGRTPRPEGRTLNPNREWVWFLAAPAAVHIFRQRGQIKFAHAARKKAFGRFQSLSVEFPGDSAQTVSSRRHGSASIPMR